MNVDETFASLAPDFFRVGDFLIRPSLKAIRPFRGFDVPSSAEKDRRIPDKAMSVLMLLAEKPRKVFTREQLLDEVWGSEREAYDRVLDNAISDLRRAFGDKARSPRYIETITKQGYRLIAEVEWPDRSAPPLPAIRYEGLDELGGPVEIAVGESSPPESVLATTRPGTAGARLSGHADPPPRGSRPKVYFVLAALAAVLLAVAVATSIERPTNLISVGEIRNLTAAVETSTPIGEQLARLLADRSCDGLVVRQSRVPWPFRPGPSIEGQLRQDGRELTLTVILDRLPGDAPRTEVEVRGTVATGLTVLGQATHELLERIEAAHCEADGEGNEIDACACYRSGHRLWSQRRYEEAEPYLERVLETDSEEILEAYDLLIRSELALGRFEEAERYVTRALDHVPEEDEIGHLRLERRRAQIVGDFDAEREALQQLWEKDPEKADWAVGLGWNHMTHSRSCTSSGLAFLDAFALEDTPFLRAYSGRTALACDKDPGRAVGLLRAYRDSNPESPYALTAFARTLRRVGDYAGARAELAEALKMAPNFAAAVLEQARTELATGQLDRAERAFERYRAMADWPRARHAAAIGLAKVALVRAGPGPVDGEEAVAHLDEAFRQAQIAEETFAGPGSAEACWIRGQVAVRRGDLDAARAEAELIHKHGDRRHSLQHQALSHHLLGLVALAEDDAEAAIKELHEALHLKPLERYFYTTALARAFLAAGRQDRAVEALEEALRHNPSYAPALCELGQLHQNRCERDTAIELYEKAFENWHDVPEDPPMRACARRLQELLVSLDNC